MSKTLRNNFAIAIVGLVGIALVAMFVGVAFATVANADTYNFARSLTVGSRGADVMQLQQMLNMSADTQIASSGAGSPGNETSYFGGLTRVAVGKWQAKMGISPTAGYFGPLSRAKANGTVTTTTTTPGTTPSTIPATGGSLSVAAAVQPANGLFVQSAARAPFTKVTFTAGSNDVTVSGITVERVGAAVDSVIAGVVLLDENGIQLGIAKTLNSNHQTTVGDPFTVRAGTSRTMTIAANAAAVLTNYAGQVVALQVDAVNTNGTVSGSLPIVGAYNTVNASLSIGTAQMAVSSYDPNGDQGNISIGTTNYRMAGVRVTAGSSEQTRVRSIRWNQVGSAGSSD
ncbi:MAG: peptidoglycan-binding protein, partial [Desulfuromonadaceae bacterium]